MCRDIQALPSKYTGANVIGVTRGRERPTVYFDDGARYTQAHGSPNNLGLKLPEPHYYFGNIARDKIDPIFDKAGDIRQAEGIAKALPYLVGELKKVESIGDNILNQRFVPPTRPSAVDDLDTMVLLEVKKGPNGEVTPHRSSEALHPVSGVEAARLLAEIRSRKSEMIPGEDPDEWIFADSDPQEMGDKQAGSASPTPQQDV